MAGVTADVTAAATLEMAVTLVMAATDATVATTSETLETTETTETDGRRRHHPAVIATFPGDRRGGHDPVA